MSLPGFGSLPAFLLLISYAAFVPPVRLWLCEETVIVKGKAIINTSGKYRSELIYPNEGDMVEEKAQ